MTYKCTCPAADNNEEAREIWSIVWQRIASVINNSRVIRYSEDRQCVCDREREGLEIGDRIVGDTVHRGILKWDNGAIEKVRGQLSEE